MEKEMHKFIKQFPKRTKTMLKEQYTIKRLNVMHIFL